MENITVIFNGGKLAAANYAAKARVPFIVLSEYVDRESGRKRTLGAVSPAHLSKINLWVKQGDAEIVEHENLIANPVKPLKKSKKKSGKRAFDARKNPLPKPILTRSRAKIKRKSIKQRAGGRVSMPRYVYHVFHIKGKKRYFLTDIVTFNDDLMLARDFDNRLDAIKIAEKLANQFNMSLAVDAYKHLSSKVFK